MTTTWVDSITELLAPAAAEVAQADLPRDRFFCVLDEQPTYLVPRRLLNRGWEDLEGRELIISPHCWFSWQPPEPNEVRELLGLSDRLALDGDVVWVANPALRTIVPFLVGPDLRRTLAGLVPGDPISPAAAGERALLSYAQIAVPAQWPERAEAAWSDVVVRSRAQFVERGYAPVAGLVHPFMLGALRRYVRAIIRGGQLPLGDEQSRRRYTGYEEDIARFFHRQLTHAVSRLVGEQVKPSYVYLASYQPGADLPKHVDREQCEFSLTMAIDYTPEPLADCPWPLKLELAHGGLATIFQALGDALLYRGRERPHFRDPLRTGHTSTSIFFHYVPQDFDGDLR